MDLTAFWNRVDNAIAKHDLLKHPFYQAWAAGELTRQDLRYYGEQYFHHVSAFPTYLTALHARLPDSGMRRAVLANAFEEECEGLAHSDLWQRFVDGMGSADIGQAPAAIAELADLVETFRSLAQNGPVAAAFGALYAYESQVPRIAAEKLDGLKRQYGADDRTCGYFALHRTADIRHSQVWKQAINDLLAQDEECADQILAGITAASAALWTALDGIDAGRPGHTGACAACRN